LEKSTHETKSYLIPLLSSFYCLGFAYPYSMMGRFSPNQPYFQFPERFSLPILSSYRNISTNTGKDAAEDDREDAAITLACYTNQELEKNRQGMGVRNGGSLWLINVHHSTDGERPAMSLMHFSGRPISAKYGHACGVASSGCYV
jgi:hypothetical protein